MKNNSKTISIIAPRYLHRQILLNKPKDVGVKLFIKQDVINLFLGSYDELAILHMAKEQNLSYEEMAAYAEFMPYIKETVHYERTKKLQGLMNLYPTKKEEIEQKIFKSKECYLYGYNNLDRDLIEVLNSNGVTPIIHELKDDLQYKCHIYEDKRIEIGEVFNRICDAISKGIKPSAITLVASTDYTIDIILYSSLFNLHFKTAGCSYFQTYDGQMMIDAFREDRLESFEVTEGLKGLKDEIIKLKEEYYSNELLLSYLTTVLKKNKVSNGSSGVNLVNSIEDIINTDRIFVIGFNNTLIKSNTNSKYISDLEIKDDTYGLECFEKDLVAERNLWNVFAQDQDVFITYSKASSSGKFQKPTLQNDNKISDEIGTYFSNRYSNKFDQVTLSILLEDYNNYGSYSDYLGYLMNTVSNSYDTYNPQYSGNFKGPEKLELSASSIVKYSKCPFAYYLSKTLKIQDGFDDFNKHVGTIAHKIIELDCDYTDPQIIKLVDGFEFNTEEDFYAKLMVTSMEPMKKILNRTRQHFSDYDLSHEVSKLITIDRDTIVKGYIDYVLSSNNSYMIFDFKSSPKKFDRLQLYFGFDVQLMVYIKLMEPSSSNNPLGAFFIPLFPTKPYLKSDKQFKYSGYFIDKPLTKGLMNDDFNLTFSVSRKADVESTGGFVKDLGYLNQIINKTIDGLRSNNYNYTPLRLKGSQVINSCKYCNFNDICFFRKKDITYLQKPDDIEIDESDEEGDHE